MTPRYAGEVGHVEGTAVITAVVLEGRSKSEVVRDYDVCRYWVQQLVKRYETEGAAAFEPHSRRPHHNPRAVGTELERPSTNSVPHRPGSYGSRQQAIAWERDPVRVASASLISVGVLYPTSPWGRIPGWGTPRSGPGTARWQQDRR